ncbi:hypothetical protein [Umezawaea sp. Da 62-37]|uniref:hypothetical protein n=1 Tax=Umezawaea sp. Da 62-37 TaxID=3075927 RepID=UPI0028F6D769|nr:hypothetical protein [Umezawaea sp. Da 62-37]WNV83942.1 hypothetical protein RM788_38130 [Umezawaea sp. Da 62-37]
MSQESTEHPSRRFRVRLRGYDRRVVDVEFAAIDSECAAAREKREAALIRIRAAAAELGSAYAKLYEYDRLHADNPTRDPLACFARYSTHTATREAQAVEEDARDEVRVVVERGDRALAVRRAELAEVHQEGLRRLEFAAAQAGRLVDETVRDFAVLADELTGRRDALDATIAGAGS